MATDEESGSADGDDESGSAITQYRNPRTFDLSEERYAVYECRECGSIVLTVNPAEEDLQCHGTSMQEITECEIDIETPDLRQVLLDAFGLPKVGLDICLCVIGEGPLSQGEVADILGYDRSTVSRYLNDLVDIGLLEKAQLNRESGGVVNVYHSIDLEQMHRETLVGFYVWAGEAASLIEEANITKQEYMEGNGSDELQEVFWEDFRDESDT